MDYNVMETQLSGEYREVFARAQLYSTLKHISDDVVDEKMIELYDLLLTAQTDKKPVNKLIGKDENKFLKNFFGDYTFAERLRRLPAVFYKWAWVLFIIESIEAIAADNTIKNFFHIRSDISGYGIGIITGILIYFICNTILAPVLLKKKKVSYGGWYLMLLAMIIVFIGVGVEFFGDTSIMLLTHPFILCSGIYIIIYLIVRSIWRYKNYGSIRDTRKKIEQDSYYRNLYDKDMEKIYLEGWQSRYNRLSKKGKVTAEGFIDKLKKEEKATMTTMTILVPVLFAAVIAFAIFDVARDSTWYDTLLFAAIIGTVEFFIARWIIRSEKKQSAMRTRVINMCEESGMTMPEYIETRLEEFKAE